MFWISPAAGIMSSVKGRKSGWTACWLTAEKSCQTGQCVLDVLLGQYFELPCMCRHVYSYHVFFGCLTVLCGG